MTIEEKVARITKLQKELSGIINGAIKDHEAKVIEMNVDQQLKGQDAGGNELGNYKPSTAKARRRKGLQVAFIDLEDTGTYHSKFTLKYKKDRVEVSARKVSYSKWLSKRWTDLFGLTDDNTKELIKLIEPTINAKVKEIMG